SAINLQAKTRHFYLAETRHLNLGPTFNRSKIVIMSWAVMAVFWGDSMHLRMWAAHQLRASRIPASTIPLPFTWQATSYFSSRPKPFFAVKVAAAITLPSGCSATRVPKSEKSTVLG
ncbi:hypothetical protein K8353_38095, partial [Burkholderia contaminans]|nr:hypothetical protein [Burkholderia contaminans]